MINNLKAPFPWFGGKRRVADLVWSALGDVDNYIEPFAGSLAVLLARPKTHDCKAETVNDADAYICNAWRAMAAAPDEVAKWCDWPVNETDLFARHLWLVENGPQRLSNLEKDSDYFDAKVAGWWLWGINSWIGSGWCSGKGPWRSIDGKLVDIRQLPHLGIAGQGVNRKRPHLSNAGRGVNRKLPHLGDAGHGVNRQHGGLYDYFSALAARLRRVRVCCGDWERVVTEGAMAYGDTVGVFLDPPYLGEVRCADLYRVDDHTISHAVREWCIERGEDKRLRIVLAGYYEEHAAKMPTTWREHRYSANKSYGTASSVGSGKGNDANRHNECLWFSPHCLKPHDYATLF